MARRKTINLPYKAKTCRKTRKRTKAALSKTKIPKSLRKKQESKWKKAAKIGLGISALAGAGALGYYGHKNKDKILSYLDSAQKYYKSGVNKMADVYHSGLNKMSDVYSSGLSKAANYYNSGVNKMSGYFNTSKDWFNKKYNDIYNSISNWSKNREIRDYFNSVNKGEKQANDIFDLLQNTYNSIKVSDPFKAKQLEPLIKNARESAEKLIKHERTFEYGKPFDINLMDTYSKALQNNLDAISHKFNEFMN